MYLHTIAGMFYTRRRLSVLLKTGPAEKTVQDHRRAPCLGPHSRRRRRQTFFPFFFFISLFVSTKTDRHGFTSYMSIVVDYYYYSYRHCVRARWRGSIGCFESEVHTARV